MKLSERLPIIFFGLFIVGITSFFWRTIEWNENNNLVLLANAVSVPATVESTAIQESLEAVGDNRQQSTMYQPVVTYTYEVNGHSYTSSRWRLSNTKSGIKSWAENDIASFKPGQRINAWVDPKDPSNAVLVHAIDFTLYAISLFISVFILLGVELLLLALVPVREGHAATPLQEMIFDLPCVLWFLVVGQKLFQYFSNSFNNQSPWAFGATVLWLGFTAMLVNFRVKGRGMMPRPSSTQLSAFGRVTGKQSPMDVFSTRSGAKYKSGIESDIDKKSVATDALNDRTIQRRPSGFFALIPLAMFLIASGSQLWKLATWEDKNNPELGTVYFSREHALKGMAMHDADVKKEPENPWSYKQRGLNYFDAQEYQKAIDDFTVTLAKIHQPDDQTVWCRARAYMLTNQWQKALGDFQTLKKIAKKPWDFYCANRGLGICNYHLKQYKEAADDFTRGLSQGRDSDNPELYHDRALCYQQLGQKEAAEKDFKAVPFWRSSSYWLK